MIYVLKEQNIRTDNYIGIPFKAGQKVHPERMLIPQSEINSNPNTTTLWCI